MNTSTTPYAAYRHLVPLRGEAPFSTVCSGENRSQYASAQYLLPGGHVHLPGALYRQRAHRLRLSLGQTLGVSLDIAVDRAQKTTAASEPRNVDINHILDSLKKRP